MPGKSELAMGTRAGRPSPPGPAADHGARRTPRVAPPPATTTVAATAGLPAVASPRVLVVDGNLLTAEAIALALGQVAFCTRFVIPASPAHLKDVIGWGPSLVLLDIDSVDHAICLECIAVLHGAGIPVAVMGGRMDSALLGECVDAGAAWVVDKGAPMTTLQADIARLLAGEAFLDDAARRALVSPFREANRAQRARLAPFDVLTQREQHVLGELMAGHSAEAIARRASVSTSTVRSQIKAVLQKLGVNSQLAAAALAAQAGWSPATGSGPPVDGYRARAS